MARASKKDQIAVAALPLFLQNGFKGTSIDMVVKTSGVSKPTVYKHFPDKASLMGYAMRCWLQQFSGLTLPDVATEALPASGLDALKQSLATGVFEADVFRIYRLVVAEGWRFPTAKTEFYEGFDAACRASLSAWAAQHDVADEQAQSAFSHYLLQGMWSAE